MASLISHHPTTEKHCSTVVYSQLHTCQILARHGSIIFAQQQTHAKCLSHMILVLLRKVSFVPTTWENRWVWKLIKKCKSLEFRADSIIPTFLLHAHAHTQNLLFKGRVCACETCEDITSINFFPTATAVTAVHLHTTCHIWYVCFCSIYVSNCTFLSWIVH